MEVFHGTSKNNLKKILATGLRKNSSLTTDFSIARDVFADSHTRYDKGIIIVFNVSKNLLYKHSDFGDADPEKEFRNNKTLDKKYITEIIEY